MLVTCIPLGFYFEHSDLPAEKVETLFTLFGLNYEKQILKQAKWNGGGGERFSGISSVIRTLYTN